MKTKLMKQWYIFHGKYMVLPKLKFILWFTKRFPGKYCWAECVSFAYGSGQWNPFKVMDSKGCEAASKKEMACYCGQWCEGKCDDKENKKLKTRTS